VGEDRARNNEVFTFRAATKKKGKRRFTYESAVYKLQFKMHARPFLITDMIQALTKLCERTLESSAFFVRYFFVLLLAFGSETIYISAAFPTYAITNKTSSSKWT
jgi:uncharacterized membrane protein